MRHTLKPALVVASLAAVASFVAPRLASAKDGPAWSDLPVGRVTTAPSPKQRPAAIGAREKTPGMFVVAPRFAGNMPDGSRHVAVVGDAKVAERIRSGGGFSTDSDRSACFMESTARFGNTTSPPTWDNNQMWQVNLWPKSRTNPQAGVAAVHVERLVERDGALVLESTDAWVDPATRGARTIGRAELPLRLVGSAIGGVKVYAARAHASDGVDSVEFVVVHDALSVAGGMGSMTVMRQDGRGARSSGCGHVRVSLPISTDGGESAVVVAPVALPALDRRDDDDAKDDAKGAKMPPGVPRMQEAEVRTRDVQVHVSVSKTSRDKTPVLAVSFGWASREQTQRTFVRVD